MSFSLKIQKYFFASEKAKNVKNIIHVKNIFAAP